MTRPTAPLAESIRAIESQLDATADSLPEPVFLFLSRVTPLINVDLLIRNDRGETLLTWRNDQFYGPGWHVPGGIIRFKEAAADRIRLVAERELGALVEHDAAPMFVHESIARERRDRGHLISLLYKCRLVGELDPRRRCAGPSTVPGQWLWHEKCPANLIPEQAAYAAFLG